MSAAALYSLDSPACYRNWSLEPANFYDTKAGGGGLSPSCKPGSGGMSAEEQGGGGTSSLAELSAAAPAMYEDESAIDFSSYIDSMSAVPNLELCNDELFADLFNSNHKAERGGDYGEYLPPAGRDPAKDFGAAGVAPVDRAACRVTWLCLHIGAGDGTCCCFWKLLEVSATCSLHP
uniref:CCAAT enhancer binding protein delta n=1 Tax=Chelonoidis abingdonii TaxID=106734 RepID=A0A8C0GE94_CHEAB